MFLFYLAIIPTIKEILNGNIKENKMENRKAWHEVATENLKDESGKVLGGILSNAAMARHSTNVTLNSVK